MVHKCDKCSYTARFKSVVKVHSFHAHGDLKPFACTFDGCTYRTKAKTHLQTHEKRRHETNPVLRKTFACPFAPCDYRAAEKKTLRYHVTARHTQGRIRDIQCSLCPSKFFCEATLKAHIRRHVKESRFRCQSCNYSTHERAKLTVHVKSVHERSVKYDCTHPGCVFTTRRRPNWNKHLQTHDPDPPAPPFFPCAFPNCSYKVSSASRLRLHFDRRHNPNRVREFSCALCPQTFFDQNTAECHVRSAHTKEKPHQCNLCSYAGFRAEQVQRHRRLEHQEPADEAQFKCDDRTEQMQRLPSMFHKVAVVLLRRIKLTVS